jgi:hypothetical protein
MLLRRHQRFAVHANGVVHNQSGYLLVGGSGCGKSTLSIRLLQQGWSYLSDDTVLLQSAQGSIEAQAINRQLAWQQRATDRDLFSKSHVAALATRAQKALVSVENLFPGRTLERCTPRVLLFPTIVPALRSSLIPIGRAAALRTVLQYSAGIMVDRDLARQQLDVLKHLVNQVISYQFLAGTDVLRRPSDVAKLLSAAHEAHGSR